MQYNAVVHFVVLLTCVHIMQTVLQLMGDLT